jgi:hypothetical protein
VLLSNCKLEVSRPSPNNSQERRQSLPPEWITASGNTTTGEIGILEYVSIGLLIDTTFFLFIYYKHFRYIGLMSFDDSISCQKIYDLLKPNVGRSIEEIGDLELEP